ncbi:hypothetical protein L1049_016921 [Liquidambar formosana]|uniref:S-protein homolog n=1 Tax=Liquidambar formosana TaxID=63359 RepID=A0AAP0S233_LIQFO
MISFNGHVVLMVLLLITQCKGGLLVEKCHLRITNDLGRGSNPTLHRKSRDDDLGEHTLPYRGYFKFAFRPNFAGTTLYYCSFKWKGGFHYFDIYIELTHRDICGSSCWWVVRPNGPCLRDSQTRQYDMCEKWHN